MWFFTVTIRKVLRGAEKNGEEGEGMVCVCVCVCVCVRAHGAVHCEVNCLDSSIDSIAFFFF